MNHSTSTPSAGAACPMFAIARKIGARKHAHGRVTITPSGTATSTTIAVTTSVISTWSPSAVNKDDALSVALSVAVSPLENTQISVTATITSTTTGCAN